MNPFERLTKARTATGEAIKGFAQAKRALDEIREDRTASAEDVYRHAQAFRDAEASMYAAIQAECVAVNAAEDDD